MTAPTEASGPSGPRASFGLRLVAYLIDLVLVGIVTVPLVLAVDPVLGQVVSLVVGIAYFGYLEGSPSGQTIGKRAVGIRVVDFASGQPLGTGRALVRYVARFLSSIPCLLGYFWMLWDKERQTWHDKLSTTVVVPVADYPVAAWPG